VRDPLLGFKTFRGFPSASSPQRLSTSRAPRVLAVYSAWSALWLALPKQNAHCTNRQHPVTLRRSAKPGYPRMLASMRPLARSPRRAEPRRHAADLSPNCRSSHQPKSMCSRAQRRSAGVHEHRNALLPAAEATNRTVRYVELAATQTPKRHADRVSSGQSRTADRRSALSSCSAPRQVRPSSRAEARANDLHRQVL